MTLVAAPVHLAVPAPVAAVAALVDGEPVGMVVATLALGVSFDPPLCTIAVQRSSSTWPQLAGSERLGVSVLGADQDAAVLRLASRDRAGRFAGVGWTASPLGAVSIDGAVLDLECSVEQVHDAGDHLLVVLRVLDGRHDSARDALLARDRRFGRYVESA
ncbi:flavin reductase family protein [Rathayibacter sp. SD072]|uniref:flavin reductase family protein n=1 Tax=Rathayibacter sp. SD072 TaxID=2781731 RepID=UPI001A968F57|nr:flavin reductase family protein [Rathayibacter sp. SD072]MBO0985151.1 flavin reductase family protein [Rathayibacter sp. SD072]